MTDPRRPSAGREPGATPRQAAKRLGGWGSAASVSVAALLAGAVPELQFGWLLPALLLAWISLLHARRRVLMRGRGSGPPVRPAAVILPLVVLPSAVLVAVCARGLGAVLIAYPAAWWAVAVALVGALVVTLARRLAVQAVAVVVVVVGVLAAGVYGTRVESEAPESRGWAHSGAIHGIHPFQTTAIIIDGYGPFDLPINDYVEPDAHRGYGPPELADALQRALHDIARIHFQDGPARARMAFGQAKVTSRVDPAIRERLDRDPDGTEHPRIRVESGTFGQRSSVQFVCPGRREDPRGHPGDNVMNRMCPDKYAAEASAGLGVTGRWPGYTEARGNERLGLSRAMGWTRSDDATGQAVVDRELRWLAWGAVLIGVVLVALGRGAPALGLRAIGGIVTAVGLGTTVVLVLAGAPATLALGPIETPALPTSSWWTPLAYAPLLILLTGLPRFERAGLADPSVPEPAPGLWGRRVAWAFVAVTCVSVASRLSSLDWVRPSLWGSSEQGLPLQAFVAGAAEAIGERWGLHILEIEGMVASAVAVALLATIAAGLLAGAEVGRRFGWRSTRTDPASLRSRGMGLLTLTAVAVFAAALIVSRKTLGGAALIPGAVGLLLVLSSTWLLQHRAAPSSGVRWWGAALAHLGWVAVAVVMLLASMQRAETGHPFVLLCGALGLVAALAALSVRPPSPPSRSG